MRINSDVLTLAQWLSPAFPIGAFAYSHGLETAINTDLVQDTHSLKEWLIDLFMFGSINNDCILLRAGYACKTHQKLLQLNDIAMAFAASAERQQEMMQQGAAFGSTAAAVWGGKDHRLAYPIAVGHAAANRQIDVTLAAAMYSQSVISNLIAAAQRLMPLGQTEGQRILATLTGLCEKTAKDTDGATLNALQSTVFLSDIASMRHETQQTRIFRT